MEDISVREHFEQRLDLEVKRLETLIETERNLRLARREDDLRASNLASEIINARLESLNHLRQEFSEQQLKFVSKDELKNVAERTMAHISTSEARFNKIEGMQAKILGGLILASIVIPVVVTLVTVIIH